MSERVLVAGVGNIFLGDDGFGVEVVRRLRERPLAAAVEVVDYGIRGLHLAFDLLDRPCSLLVLVDATPRGHAPGTVYLIDPALDEVASPEVAASAHSMTPDAVFASLRALGGVLPPIRIVGCEPGTIEEGMGLSGPVLAAVDRAVDLVGELVESAATISASPEVG
jgi:hydrogenase maturation protease